MDSAEAGLGCGWERGMAVEGWACHTEAVLSILSCR